MENNNIIAYKILDSTMSPTLEKGDIVTIDRSRPPLNGEVGACILNGGGFIKRYQEEDGKIFLLSDNGRSRIEVNKTDDFIIIGKMTMSCREL